jgi:hypothetical protein
MKNRPVSRALTVALLSAASFAGVAGCSAIKKMSPSPSPTTAAADEAPKKDYHWQDMSAGHNFYGQPRSAPPDRSAAPTPPPSTPPSTSN